METKYDFVKKYREQVLQCSRCGFCQAVCPVYGATLRPSFNARGKMLILKEVMEGKIPLNDELIDTLFQCTTCASCHQNCPSGVNVPDIIKQVRKDMVHIGSCHPAFKGMNEVLEKNTNIYAEDEGPDFGRQKNKKAEYVFFIGCVGAYREDESTEATLDLLDRIGVNYTLIDEVCCSGVLEDVGYQLNERLAKKNIELILATGAKTVVTGCPYCSRTFNNKPQYEELKEKGVKVIHISQLLKDFDLGVQTAKKVTYHDPCDLGRNSGVFEEPRQVLKAIPGLKLVEMDYNRQLSMCCGGGGNVEMVNPELSAKVAQRKLQDIADTKADMVVSSCQQCLRTIATRARRDKVDLVVKDLTELVFEAMS